MPRSVGVVMAGGRGERFWPLSTPERPKQFLDLTGNGTLLQQTVVRLAQVIPLRDVLVVTGAQFLDLARSQLPELPPQNFLPEPVGRDTAPCVGLAAVWTEKLDPNALMFVVPADHYIPDHRQFALEVGAALRWAEETQGLVTLGIQPDRPETGYGYIEKGETLGRPNGLDVHRVARFVEKPDRPTAEAYLASGRFLWNAGMFAWSIHSIREEIARHLPDLHAGLEELAASGSREALLARLPDIFPRLPKISIDYGVMERSDQVYVIPSQLQWDDLGSWTAVARHSSPDAEGNVLKGNVIVQDSQNVYVQADSRLVATLGVDNLIVVETADAVLICSPERAQDVRKIATLAKEKGPRSTPVAG
ncbi:MAG: mannose-1-phosphate guanylyltransferase [Symbiobacteriia bacterium]